MNFKIGFSLISFVSLVITELVACSCVPEKPIKEDVDSALMVFAGTVIDARSDSGDRTVRFKVTTAYKGEMPNKLSVHTSEYGAMCGYPFRKKESYLVFVHLYEKKLYTSICTRTKKLSDAKEELAYLKQRNVSEIEKE
jgi:hypothetical protein